MTYLLVNMLCIESQMIEDGAQQLLLNSYQKRDPISSKLMTMSYTEKTSTFKTLYT